MGVLMALRSSVVQAGVEMTDEVQIANRTSRASGAVGDRALVPRVVREWIKPTDQILDFGAGKTAAHAMKLRSEGYDVTAHEFGANQVLGTHDERALSRTFDVVYASNVLNVQSSAAMLCRTLTQIRSVVKPGGLFIANFPKKPRKITNISPADLADMIASIWHTDVLTVRLGKQPSAGRVPAEPIFFVR